MSDSTILTRRCAKCGCEKYGNAELCVQCFKQSWIPCFECSHLTATAIRLSRVSGKPIDCSVCNNERWVRKE